MATIHSFIRGSDQLPTANYQLLPPLDFGRPASLSPQQLILPSPPMNTFLTELKTAVLLTVIFAVILCGLYPLAVWAGAQTFFRDQANGSLIIDQTGQIRGSKLLAQNFSSPGSFHPRPSAAGLGFDATASSGTNLGPTSAKLVNGIHLRDAAGNPIDDSQNFDGIKDLLAAYRVENGLAETQAVPADAVTRSASGLDPHISLANAQLQAPRVAQARNLPLERVLSLIAAQTESRDLGVFGEIGVNVLLLNLALEHLR